MSIRTPASKCDECGNELNAARYTSSEDIAPIAGDVSICFYCATVRVYGDDLKLRKPTAEEQEEFIRDPMISSVVARLLIHRKK